MPRVFGFAKLRNEIVREGDLYRVLRELDSLCEYGVICDDASTDGTREYLRGWAKTRPNWTIIEIAPEAHDFADEMGVKQDMIAHVHARVARCDVATPDWILWLDGDEEINATRAEFEAWLATVPDDAPGVRMRYMQLWRTAGWARTDGGFDDGVFVKLWRYAPALSFDTTKGTHRQQFPREIPFAACPIAPFHVVHWGNVGKNLVWKAIQYSGGKGGVDRHIAFGHTPEESMASGVGFDVASWSSPSPTYRPTLGQGLPEAQALKLTGPPPQPFTLGEIARIRAMAGMHKLPHTFTVCIPAYNRADDLRLALESLIHQTYPQWIAVVLDDGSTDHTAEVMREYQDRDPRIFYVRYPDQRGGVVMNEIGMSLACEWSEWWTRLGSDDWWGPGKLAADAATLIAGAEAVFAPFRVWRNGAAAEVCAGSWRADLTPPSARLLAGEFLASWANVAIRTSVLAKVRARHGNFVDPRLKNMEDFLLNVRVARVAEWTWRPGDPEDAWWRCLESVGAAPSASASANAEITHRDLQLTRELIVQESR